MKSYCYLICSNDAYLLPCALCDTIGEVADWLQLNYNHCKNELCGKSSAVLGGFYVEKVRNT